MKEERDRTPEGRFKYLAEKRMEKALRAIASIGNLADTKNYRYEERQVNQMLSALERAVEEVVDEFSKQKRQKGKSFSFDD